VFINYNLTPKDLNAFLSSYGQKVNSDELLAAYKVHSFIISIRLLRMADMMENQKRNTKLAEIHAVCNLYQRKQWPEVIQMLQDRDAVYALSELLLISSQGSLYVGISNVQMNGAH
jgi:hypothetical protein